MPTKAMKDWFAARGHAMVECREQLNITGRQVIGEGKKGKELKKCIAQMTDHLKPK